MTLICDLCHIPIQTKKEKYVHVENWEREEKGKELWAHLVCFNSAMNRDLTETEKQAKEMLARCGDIMDKFYGKKQEEFVLT